MIIIIIIIIIIKPSYHRLLACQLIDSDHTQYPDDFKPQEEYMYWVTEVWGSG